MRHSIYNIGPRIQQRRKQKHWTQKDLAQRIGASYKHLSRIENGTKFPSLEMLICLSRELDVSLDYLISADTDTETDHTSLPGILEGCTPEEQAFLLDIMAYIKGSMKKHAARIE